MHIIRKLCESSSSSSEQHSCRTDRFPPHMSMAVVAPRKRWLQLAAGMYTKCIPVGYTDTAAAYFFFLTCILPMYVTVVPTDLLTVRLQAHHYASSISSQFVTTLSKLPASKYLPQILMSHSMFTALFLSVVDLVIREREGWVISNKALNEPSAGSSPLFSRTARGVSKWMFFFYKKKKKSRSLVRKRGVGGGKRLGLCWGGSLLANQNSRKLSGIFFFSPSFFFRVPFFLLPQHSRASILAFSSFILFRVFWLLRESFNTLVVPSRPFVYSNFRPRGLDWAALRNC